MRKIRVSLFWATLAVLLGSAVATQAQELGRIEGRVVAEESAVPLYGANVVVRGTLLGGAARRDGTYFVAGVPQGHHEIEVSMMGYALQRKGVDVVAGATVTVSFELVETVLDLGEVVVTTATRTPRYIKDVPVRTEVVTGTAIKDKGAANLYEALEGTSGVRVEQQCSACNFSVLRMQGLEGDHVQILVDGQPVYSGLAGVYGLQQIPSANIERVEIVKGAGSALYGSSAIAGAVNVVTKQPTRTPMLKFSSTFGSHKTNQYSVVSSQTLGNQDLIFTAQKNTGKEIDQDGDGLTDRVELDNIATGIRVNWHDLWGQDQFSVSGRTLNESRQGGELATFENPFAPGAEHVETGRYEAGVAYSKTFGWDGEMGISTNYVSHDRNATNDTFLGDYQLTHRDAIPAVDELEPYIAREKLYVVDASYSHPLADKHRLLAGVQYRRNELEETGRYVIVDENDPGYGETYTSIGNKRADDLGFYAQGEFLLSPDLELVAGARFDSHDSEADFGGAGDGAPEGTVALDYDETAFNPRAALRYSLGSWTFRTSVGTGFRVPYGFAEDLHLCSGSPRVYKPGGLKPEKSRSVNLGADYDGDGYTLSLNLFRTDVKDKVGLADADETTQSLGFTYQWENFDEAFTQGIEAGARVELPKGTVLDMNVGYTDAQYESRRPDWVENHSERFASASRFISRVPKWAGGIKLEFSPGEWRFVTETNYTGSMYIDYNEEDNVANPGSRIVHTDPYWLVNGRISKEITRSGISLFGGVRNAFDFVQEERHPDDAAFIYAPLTGRTVYGGIEFNFSGGEESGSHCGAGRCEVPNG
ncbi:MAG: TonB-dependent receptor [Candidatus Eisenbacteria sp.]|nr:TonB-dependent receptor [Candidatus Eisenbacteria bacterium]